MRPARNESLPLFQFRHLLPLLLIVTCFPFQYMRRDFGPGCNCGSFLLSLLASIYWYALVPEAINYCWKHGFFLLSR